MMPNLKTRLGQSSHPTMVHRNARREGGPITWIPSLTVGAKVVSGNALEEVLQGLLVARLLALA
jgi:hypothetical protein